MWDGVVSVGEMKAVTQHFGLSSSGCRRAANDDAWRGGTVVPTAVARMYGGGRRPVWVSLGRNGCWAELGCWAKRLFLAKMREKENRLQNRILNLFKD
jgi:hypothetical protein